MIANLHLHVLIPVFILSLYVLSVRKPMSPPRTPVTHSSASSPLTTVGRADGGAPMPKHGPFMLRATHPSQASELYYQEAHSAYDAAHYQPTCESICDSIKGFNLKKTKNTLFLSPFPPSFSPAGSYYPSTLHPPHKPCMAQFLRSSNVSESSLPPSLGPPPSSYASDPQAPHPPSSSSSGYPPHPPRDRMGPPAFHSHPGQPQYGPLAPAHGVYAPLYDSRRVWRPQVSHPLIIACACSLDQSVT